MIWNEEALCSCNHSRGNHFHEGEQDETSDTHCCMRGCFCRKFNGNYPKNKEGETVKEVRS